MAHDEVKHDRQIGTSPFSIVEGYHRPPCLNQNLDENKLGSQKSLKIRMFTIISIFWRHSLFCIVKNLHSNHSQAIVSNHEKREKLYYNWHNNCSLTQNLTDSIVNWILQCTHRLFIWFYQFYKSCYSENSSHFKQNITIFRNILIIYNLCKQNY